jgi:hypothetical protein
MPLTAVGKIFKPALRLDSIRRCVRSVAQLDCAKAVEVDVRDAGGSVVVVLKLPDPAGAQVVEIIRRELERYTFCVEVEPGS